ncbi:hypothetical protein V8F06_009852 [Rhypophila decipiens]
MDADPIDPGGSGNSTATDPSQPPLQAPAPPPLSNPPPDHNLMTKLYDSFDELYQDLVTWATSAGFGVIKKRSTDKLPGFSFTRIDLACWRGHIRPDEGFSRGTSTNKRNCTWSASAKALPNNAWGVRNQGKSTSTPPSALYPPGYCPVRHPLQSHASSPWLDESLVEKSSYLKMKEFDVASLRGRPRGSKFFKSDPKAPRIATHQPIPTQQQRRNPDGTQPSIRRDPSGFEGVNLQAEDLVDGFTGLTGSAPGATPGSAPGSTAPLPSTQRGGCRVRGGRGGSQRGGTQRASRGQLYITLTLRCFKEVGLGLGNEGLRL